MTSSEQPRRLGRIQRARRGFQWPVALWLTAVWVLLWGDLSVANVAGGALVSLVVVTVFPLPPIAFTGKVHPVGLLRLVLWFARDLTVASAHVAYLAMRPGRQPMNAMIAVPLHSRGDLYLMITAELVSLVPGSLLVETSHEDFTLYLHILDTNTMEDVEHARRKAYEQEERVVLALASDAEIRDYRIRAEGGTP